MLQKKIIESKRKMLPNCTASKAQEQSWKPRTWVNDNDNTWRNRSSKVNESSKVMRHKSPVLCFQEEKLTEAAEWGAKRTKRPPKNLKKKQRRKTVRRDQTNVSDKWERSAPTSRRSRKWRWSAPRDVGKVTPREIQNVRKGEDRSADPALDSPMCELN